MNVRKTLHRISVLLIVFCFTVSGYAQSKDLTLNTPTKGVATLIQGSIVDHLLASKEHTTLVAALKAAGLEKTLAGSGPFTLFAPTNSAFAALPAGTLEHLLKAENKAQLKAILMYHVVSGNNDAASIIKAVQGNNGETDLKTVNGSTVSIYTKGGAVVLTDGQGNDANVKSADITKSNGVIHVIDHVILPGTK